MKPTEFECPSCKEYLLSQGETCLGCGYSYHYMELKLLYFAMTVVIISMMIVIIALLTGGLFK